MTTETTVRLRDLTRVLWVTVVCFVLGVVIGAAALWGEPRPFSGAGSIMIPAALTAGVIAAAAFVVSTRMHRTGETSPMPRWQAVISHVSAVAVTVAIAGVTALGVLLTGMILGLGLQGLEVTAFGGGALTGVAAAVGGRLAYRLGSELRTSGLATLLFSFIIIGTVFAMLTAEDPTWWQRNFSQLGIGAWAFNGTLMVAGLLVATVGSYIGRDLHRMLGDTALRKIAVVVVSWVLAGAALAAVGALPIDRVPVPHAIAAVGTLVFVLVAVIAATVVTARQATLLRVLTGGFVVLTVIAALLADPFKLYSVTVLEGIVIGLVLVWLSTFVQVIAVLAPRASRPSERQSPLARG